MAEVAEETVATVQIGYAVITRKGMHVIGFYKKESTARGVSTRQRGSTFVTPAYIRDVVFVAEILKL